jgi:hypothetical protein
VGHAENATRRAAIVRRNFRLTRPDTCVVAQRVHCTYISRQ